MKSEPSIRTIRSQSRPFSDSSAFVGEIPQGYLADTVPSELSIGASKYPVAGGVVSVQTYEYNDGSWIDENEVPVAEPVVAGGAGG